MAKTHFKSQMVPNDSTEEIGRVFLPWHLAIAAISAAGTTLNGVASGDPVTTSELNTSSGFTGMAVAADADAFQYLWVLPQDFNSANLLDSGTNNTVTIYPWCHIESAAETGDGADWTLLYKAMNGTTDTLIEPAVTAGVTKGSLTWQADNALTRASTGIVLDVGTATTISSTTKALILKIECTLMNGAEGTTGFITNEQNFFGIEIEYGRKFV